MINGIILLVNGCKVMRSYKLWLIIGIYGGDAVKKTNPPIRRVYS